MSSNPTNPVLGPDHKPVPGQTRGHDGHLEWFDSYTNTWRPAVRQHTIRNRLIRQSRHLGSYTYPRDGRGDDVASFLPKDRDFGLAWAHRPAILFQLYAGPNRVSAKPQGVLMDGNRIMLDPYDHPIRDFPELPVTLSSKEKGMWIEYYMRQNKEIRPYDLMARMGKPANGNAVRIYTLNERATKFRNTAACLSWGEKTGSAEKKAYILSLLPPGATDTRSLGGDLTKVQQEQLISVNKGKFPNRRRKNKRTLEAQAPMALPTPGFHPQAPPADDEVQGQSDQETEPSRLEERDTQPTDRNGPSRRGAPQNLFEQGLNMSPSITGANFDGYYYTQGNLNPDDVLATSQLDPSQSLLNNSGDWSSLNNLRYRSFSTSTSRGINNNSFLNPTLYGTTYGGKITKGESSGVIESRNFATPQTPGDSLFRHPVNTPIQGHKRPRMALAEDEAGSNENRTNKRVRNDAHVEAPQDPSASQTFGDAAESLLLFDENGFVIPNNAPGMQGHAERLYPAAFDKFLQDTQHIDNDAENLAAQTTRDAPAAQGSNIGLLDTPASLLTQGQKRRRSSTSEGMEEGSEGPKSKRVRTQNDAQTPAESTHGLFEEVDERLTSDPNTSAELVGAGEGLDSTSQREQEDETPPIQVSRGQKRGRGSSESSGDSDSDLETPTAKRQRTDGSGAFEEDESSNNDDEALNNDEASQSSHHASSADSDDGSEYTPSPYYQTSLKSINRPTTGGKGPYTSSGRPVTGGKGPLQSSRRANVGRKTLSQRK